MNGRDLQDKWLNVAAAGGMIEGVRVWHVGRDRDGKWELRGAVHTSAWARGVNVAECGANGGHGAAPDPRCNCGFQARFPERRDITDGYVSPKAGEYIVVGRIEAWGRMIIGTNGFRAQYAQVVALESIQGAEAPTRRSRFTRCALAGCQEQPTHLAYLPTFGAAASWPKVVAGDYSAVDVLRATATDWGSPVKVCAGHATNHAPAPKRRECEVRDCHRRPYAASATSAGGKQAWNRCRLHAPRFAAIADATPATAPTPAAPEAAVLRELAARYDCLLEGSAAEVAGVEVPREPVRVECPTARGFHDVSLDVGDTLEVGGVTYTGPALIKVAVWGEGDAEVLGGAA